MKNYEVIFFDIDDTLFDFTAAEKAAFSNVFKQHRLSKQIQLYRKTYQEISKGLWDQLEKGIINLQSLSTERFKQLFKQYHISLDPVLFNAQYLQSLSEQTVLMPGAEKTVKALSDKRLAVMTNGFAHVQTARIAQSPFANKFEEIIISEEVGFHKPKKEIFDYAFNQLNLQSKDNVLIVGDSLTSDIQGGIGYGIDTCWYNPKLKQNKTTIKPTYEITHLTDLQQIVQ